VVLRPRTAWLLRVAVALGLSLALGWGPYQLYGRSGLARLIKLRGELTALRDGNRLLRGEAARLRAEVALHEEDPLAAVERAAREGLGLVRPGEVVFQVEAAPAGAPR
jgi:cell division protein FtsB